jgi:hypothetical protein
VSLRLRARYRGVVALGIRLGRSPMIHWDWVLTLVTAIFIVKTVELFLRVLVDVTFDIVYPYMKSFAKTMVTASFPQAGGLVDELLPDDPATTPPDDIHYSKGTDWCK